MVCILKWDSGYDCGVIRVCRKIRIIRNFIKENYESMYMTWRTMSANGFYMDRN